MTKFRVTSGDDQEPLVLDDWARAGTEVIVEHGSKRLRVRIRDDGFHISVGDLDEEPCLKVVE